MNAQRDEYRMGWRAPRKPMAVRRPTRTLRSRIADACVHVLESVRAIPGGEPSFWRDVAVFLTGTTWGAMLAVGLLLTVRP